MSTALKQLNRTITECQQCPRLIDWCAEVARVKRKAYENDPYWGGPVPSFGDPKAGCLVVGLAPGAHGANRTGRMFTGDRSGDWLYRALFNAGLANQPESTGRDDGLELRGARVTGVVHCAPPDNKPTTEERDACIGYLVEEFVLMKQVKAVVALGRFAWDGALRALAEHGHACKPKPKFAHLAEADVGPYTLIGSFHPSQQNTFTGRLTEPMLDAVFVRASEVMNA